jgi:ADP-ribosylglycohydrolase
MREYVTEKILLSWLFTQKGRKRNVMHNVLDLGQILSDELVQRREDGYDVSTLEQEIEQAISTGTQAERERLYQLLEQTTRYVDWPYDEPSTLPAIRVVLPPAVALPPLALSEDELRDRLRSAWLGRCAGCALGKPVEGWDRTAIRHYLEAAHAYPLDNYFPFLDSTFGERQLNACWPETTRGNIRFMARDDDIDYTILGLYILETYGFDFEPQDVADTWLSRLPFLATYTAERAAYRNLIYGLEPPATARYHNPYREWIGAQIRADIWGYVSPGKPRRAASLAYRDATLSHVQNGIYGEMWAAALIAACFVASDMMTALKASLAHIPQRSRLAEAVRDVMDLYTRGLDWEAARDVMQTRFYSSYSFVHTVNNAAVVAAALLWGEGDYTRTIGLAVQGGWDTDCNGATAGSAFGAMHGTSALPAYWVEPLNDRIRSAVFGFDNASISDLAERTLALALTQCKTLTTTDE